MHETLQFTALLVLLASIAACGGKTPLEDAGPEPAASAPAAPGVGPLPKGHPPLDKQPPVGQVIPPDPSEGVGENALSWDAPNGWLAETPSSRLRRAQYRTPGPGGDGECVVFYFGPGEGGDAKSNALRWAQQFNGPDGEPALDAMKMSEITVGGMRVTLVEVSGVYDGGMGAGMADEPAKPDYMLLGAIAEGPDANWFFKFTGPRETLVAERAAFEAMIQSLRKGD